MKKLFTVAIIAISALAMTSCSKENVSPKVKADKSDVGTYQDKSDVGTYQYTSDPSDSGKN